MESEKDVVGLLNPISNSIDEIEKHLDPLLGNVSLKEVSDRTSHIENAKLYSALAYTLDSLFFIYLRTKGVSPVDHPIMKELDRVKRYIDKVKNATKKPEIPEVNKNKVDHQAAIRFISAALSGDKTEVTKELRAHARNLTEDDDSVMDEQEDSERSPQKTMKYKKVTPSKRKASKKNKRNFIIANVLLNLRVWDKIEYVSFPANITIEAL